MTDAAVRKTLGQMLMDEVRFVRSLITTPSITGAISPSGRDLARLMASFVDPTDPLPVLELGPGTGVVTEALLKRGVAPGKLLAVEYSAEFCRLLGKRLPGVRVVEGDAYGLDRTLAEADRGPFSAVVSSLPLLTRPAPDRVAFIEDALARMAPGKPLIQFSYSLFPPVAAIPGRFSVTRSRWVFWNLPPARVWVYRRDA